MQGNYYKKNYSLYIKHISNEKIQSDLQMCERILWFWQQSASFDENILVTLFSIPVLNKEWRKFISIITMMYLQRMQVEVITHSAMIIEVGTLLSAHTYLCAAGFCSSRRSYSSIYQRCKKCNSRKWLMSKSCSRQKSIPGMGQLKCKFVQYYAYSSPQSFRYSHVCKSASSGGLNNNNDAGLND